MMAVVQVHPRAKDIRVLERRQGGFMEQKLKKRQDCWISPARINENHSLELPGVGERPGNSWPSGSPEGGGPRCAFSLRDEA